MKTPAFTQKGYANTPPFSNSASQDCLDLLHGKNVFEHINRDHSHKAFGATELEPWSLVSYFDIQRK